MKKTLLIAGIVSVTLLVGCGQSQKEASLENAPRFLTPVEEGLFKSYSRSINNRYINDYSSTMIQIIDNRSTISSIRNGGYKFSYKSNYNKLAYEDNTHAPLCNVMQNVLLDEISIRENYSNKSKLESVLVSSQFKKLYGESMQNYCPSYFNNKEAVIKLPETKVEVKEKVGVVSVEGEEVLSPELYDKVFDAVTKCKRASNELLELTQDKDYLTKSDYSAVMKQVMRCKAFQLEQKLNKN